MSTDPLISAAYRVDVLDAAGRIIANPRRRTVAASSAEVLALAWATEVLNGIAIEAELLVRALQLPITGNDSHDAARDNAIQMRLASLAHQFAVMRAADNLQTEKEDTDANRSA
ncbi:hypothetical protein [Aquamicrobium sp.]|uniref:hypothetical protein n=1 Tax=Aquamicrobium sp. TaxID=1872579 RepID=UPI002588464B|nr:hypothetical protein [Aquamicrobium sp.]MCK9551593.1 hypothetical protein [Aquamicrobium sp.]